MKAFLPVCVFAVACGGARSPAEIARMNREAEFEFDGEWRLAGEKPIDVTDADHFRTLLRDPAPKMIRIDDFLYSSKEHAVLCAPLVLGEIRVTRLAVRLHHIDRPFAEAVACLARLPIEYLTIDEYAHEGPSLDVGRLLAFPGLRGLAINGFRVKPFTAARGSSVEDLRVFALFADPVTEGAAFFASAIALPRLHTIGVRSDGNARWSYAQVEPITRLSALRTLHLAIPIAAADLSQLVAALPRLHELRLPFEADDTVAAALARAPALRVLKLGANKMSDAALAFVAQLTTLEELYVNASAFSDAAIAHLGALTSLRTLKLSSLDHVTGESFAALGRLVHLERLELGAGPIEPQHYAHLANLRELRVLILGKGTTPHTCETLRFLDGLTKLVRLRLDDTVVGCLDHLKGMTQLATLELNRLDDALFATPPPRTLTGAHLRALRSLPLETLALGDIDDSAALELGRMSSLRRLSVISWRLSARGVIHLMRSRSLRVLALGAGDDDKESWSRWRAIQRARCGNHELVVTYCPAPHRGVMCGTGESRRSCAE